MIYKLLNKEELELTKELINVGLKNAAKAFSAITGGNVTISTSEYGMDYMSETSGFCSSKGDNVHVLMTKVRGEIEGVCFLLFSGEEVENLLDTSLPAGTEEQPHNRKMMADAFLIETDNIISASVITQFANLLDKMLYGDVPNLHKMPEKEVEDFITGFMNEQDILLLFKTKFTADHIDMNPEFVWLMKTEFIEGVKESMKQDNLKEKLINL